MKLFIIMVLIIAYKAAAANLAVKVSQLRSEDGYIRYLLFKGKNGFPDDDGKSLRKGSVEVKGREESFILTGLPPGSYALALIHDENSNNKLDKNFLGIPSEGFGFSNNPVILFGPPSFDKSSFAVDADTSIVIKVRHL